MGSSLRGHFPRLLFNAKLGFLAGVCELEYGISAFDSESFELEYLKYLMGEQGTAGHLWLEFRPNPFSVFGDQVSPHVYTMSGLP